MSRRNRKTAKKTPLSALDKLIYFFLWIIGMGIIFGVIIVFDLFIPDRIAMSDPSVISYDNDIVMAYTAPLLIAVMIVIFIILGYAGQYKIPVFGNKNYKPKSFEIVIPTYPLFSKKFSLNFSDRQKKNIKRFFLVMLIVTLIAMAILPFGICRRLTLDKNDTVKIYDSFNRCEIYSWSEAENVRVYISRGKHGPNLNFVFEYNNDHYEFNIGSFKKMSRYEALEYMLYLKENSGDFTVGSTRRIEQLIYLDYYTTAEQELLYQLFDYTP